jgi:hypothetical protein
MAFLQTYVLRTTDAADIAAYIATPAAGTRLAATLSTTLGFGSRWCYDLGPDVGELTNTGSANLVLSAVTLGGTNASASPQWHFARGSSLA